MKGNYWGGAGLSSNLYSFNFFIIDPITGIPSCSSPVSYDDSQFATVFNTNCEQVFYPIPQDPIPPNVKCEIQKDGETVMVHEQNRLAYVDLVEENYLSAKSKYQPVADLTSADVNTEASCLNKIYFARCMTNAINDDFAALIALINKTDWEETAIRQTRMEKNFSIYPNPANDFLIIRNAQIENFELKIYNTFGQLEYTSKFTTEHEIEVEGFRKGVYIIDVLNLTTKERFQDKIIIQ